MKVPRLVQFPPSPPTATRRSALNSGNSSTSLSTVPIPMSRTVPKTQCCTQNSSKYRNGCLNVQDARAVRQTSRRTTSTLHGGTLFLLVYVVTGYRDKDRELSENNFVHLSHVSDNDTGPRSKPTRIFSFFLPKTLDLRPRRGAVSSPKNLRIYIN